METKAVKNITLSANEQLIEAARARARAERTTLDELFRLWLADYAGHADRASEAMAVIDEMRPTVRTGGQRFSRDEMNRH